MISNCPIPPKTSFTYIFRVNDKPGTYFYHGHLGGIRAAGLYGVLIIDPASGVSEQWSYDGEYTLLLSDWYHAIQHELSIGLLEEEFRWAGMRAQFLTKLVLLLISLQPRPQGACPWLWRWGAPPPKSGKDALGTRLISF